MLHFRSLYILHPLGRCHCNTHAVPILSLNNKISLQYAIHHILKPKVVEGTEELACLVRFVVIVERYHSSMQRSVAVA